MKAGQDPIVVKQHLAASPAVVWQAITDKHQMQQWFFETIEDFQPEVGFETEFIVHCEGTDYPHQWKVTDVNPQKRIAYRWRYGGLPGDSMVIWELTETPEGTSLLFTHEVHESFPEDNPLFSRESGEAGWNYFIRERLPEYLKQPVQ